LLLKDSLTPSILLNCAGIQRRYPSAEFPDEAWNEVIQVNLSSIFTLSRDFGAYLLAHPPDEHGRRGSIINIASIMSFQGGIQIPAYAAAKGGLSQLTKSLSNEWAKEGINVNAIAPGYVKTELTEPLQNHPVRGPQILSRIPAGRWGNPEDFKGVTVWLASRASAYVNGETVVVDGGWMGQ
jgi:2-deoxy-D-gluconate 3-dehydrogenase